MKDEQPPIAPQPGVVSAAWLDRLRRAEREAARAALSSHFVHKLGTPLNVLLGRAKMIVDAEGLDESVTKNALAVVQTVQQMIAQVRGLAVAEGEVALSPSRADFVGLVGEACEIFARIAEQRDIELSREGDASAQTWVDRLRAYQLVTSKLGRLLEGRGGRLVVEVASERIDRPADLRCAPGPYVVVTMTRQGDREPDQETAPSKHEEREDIHVARMLGGFLEPLGEAGKGWRLCFPERSAPPA